MFVKIHSHRSAGALLALAIAGFLCPAQIRAADAPAGTAAAAAPAAGTVPNPNGQGNPKADPAAYALLKAAHDSRQVVPENFGGFTANVAFDEDGKSYAGTITYRRQGKTEISIAALTPDQKAWVDDKLLSLIGHRRGGDFAQGDGRNALSLDQSPENTFGRLINLNDRMQSSYRVKDNKVREVTRVAGNTRFTISVMESMEADPGKYLATHFTVAYRDAKTNALKSFEGFRDSYGKVEGVWLPVGRAVYEFGEAVTPTVRSIRLSEIKILPQGS